MLDTATKLLPMLTQEGMPERCGLVLKTGRVVEVSNVAENPVTGFRMNPSEVLKFLTKKRAVPVATWHTHPGSDPNLSELDYEGFLRWPEWIHYIIGIRNRHPTVVRFEILNDVVVETGEIQL
jgi:proteasome lid subunit RPN8/RPN11